MSAQSSINRIESDLQTVLQKRSTRTRPWKLSDRDVKDVGKVLAKLKDSANPAAVHLLNRFSPANRAKINGITASSESMAETRLVLANEFNNQIDDAKSDLLTADFSKVKLRDS